MIECASSMGYRRHYKPGPGSLCHSDSGRVQQHAPEQLFSQPLLFCCHTIPSPSSSSSSVQCRHRAVKIPSLRPRSRSTARRARRSSGKELSCAIRPKQGRRARTGKLDCETVRKYSQYRIMGQQRIESAIEGLGDALGGNWTWGHLNLLKLLLK